MRKFVMVVVALLYSFIGANVAFAADGAWTQKANFGGEGRLFVLGLSIGNKGYIGGGLIFNTTYFQDFWEYDPATDVWTQKADLLSPSGSPTPHFSIGNIGYVAVLTRIDPHEDFVSITFTEYDPASNTWTKKETLPETPIDIQTSFSIGNKGYMGTGTGGTMKEFWEYDPATNTLTRKADFGGCGRYDAVGFSIGNKGYIGGGIASSDSDPGTIEDDFDETTKAFKDFWEYDPSTDTWTRRANIGGPGRQLITGSSIGNKGYIYGGIAWSGYNVNNNDFWEYDPAIDTWTKKADFLGEVRDGAAMFSVNNKGYIASGATINYGGAPTYRKDAWEYDPNGGSNDIIIVPVADKTSLWPPNNKLVPVTIWSNVSSSLPVTLTVQISCNEPAKRGKDWTEPVIDQATGIISLSLRATRAGSGTGRIYTITITATDANGNSATQAIDIVVPHDQGNN